MEEFACVLFSTAMECIWFIGDIFVTNLLNSSIIHSYYTYVWKPFCEHSNDTKYMHFNSSSKGTYMLFSTSTMCYYYTHNKHKVSWSSTMCEVQV